MYDINKLHKAEMVKALQDSPRSYAGMQKGTPRASNTYTVHGDYNPENFVAPRPFPRAFVLHVF